MSSGARFRLSDYVKRSVWYYWRTNVAVVAAVAVAIGVLTGALLVGDSVRSSLRELFLSRLGATDTVVVASTFFRDALGAEIEGSTAPIIAFEGMVTAERSGRRRARVQVYGIDARFWTFHGVEAAELGPREAFVTASLRDEIEAGAGDTVLLRVEIPSDVSRESLHGEKENVGRTIRLTVADGLEATGLPEFSLFPSQDAVRAVLVPLERLQADLGREGRVNAVLVSGAAVSVSELPVTLDDLGIRILPVGPDGEVAVESDALMLSAPVVDAVTSIAEASGAGTSVFFTYLANTFRVREEETPYSLVTGVDEATYASLSGTSEDGIVINEWLAEDLGAAPGDDLSMAFYVWEDDGSIETREASFTVDAVVPMEGLAADRHLAPDYPGISETENLSDWEPPFPIDLRRVRGKDEAYWDDYRATPKAFVPLARAQTLWPVRQGRLTSIRIEGAPADFGERLLARLDPYALGFTVTPVREEGLEAATGATDFGEYFFYFSYFLVVAALMLSGLFFKLGVEQRHREIGTLLATGFGLRDVRRLFLAEGLLLSSIGAAVGIGVALAYAGAILLGLRTFWIDAVGTRLLTLAVEPVTLATGLVLGILSALGATWLTLRSLSKIAARRLLAGDVGVDPGRKGASKRAYVIAGGATIASAAFLVAAVLSLVPDVVGFFGSGNLLLLALLVFQWAWLSRPSTKADAVGSLAALGVRNASHRPGRSLVAIALIAFATFIIVAVDAFRKNDAGFELSQSSGNGGYALTAESLLPLNWNPNTDEGRNAFNLPYPGESDAIPMTFQSFRLRGGDDASCLNLYRPQNPRVLAVNGEFIEEGRFAFAATLAETPEEAANPWLLLRRRFDDGAVPVIGDQNSMTYVLHLGLGEDFELSETGREPLKLRLVATLRDSVFQAELLMAEESFVAHFPGEDGFRYFLVETAPEDVAPAEALLETRLSDFGLDVTSTAEKIARFHRVENTYLSTFQSLGGLGLVLGTLGLGAVLLRNVLERRKELALLRAVGYQRSDFKWMILAENALLLALGLVTGTVSALVAIAPAFSERGGHFDAASLGLLLAAVVSAGLVASAVGVAAALKAPLLASLRAE